jgi:biopolymer transport protein ExbD
MLTIRRTQDEPRIELMPMIDVIFLLLTFFIYAMVLMIRAELLPMEMQEFKSGEPARPSPAITLSIDKAGDIYCNRQAVSIDDVVGRLKGELANQPGAIIYLAADARGDTDRLPVFLELYDRLAFAGMDVNLVGKPSDDKDTD